MSWLRRFTAERVGKETLAFAFHLGDATNAGPRSHQTACDQDGVLILVDQLGDHIVGIEVVSLREADIETHVREHLPPPLAQEMVPILRSCSAALHDFKRITGEGSAYMFKYAMFDSWRALPQDQKCSRVLTHDGLIDGCRIEGTWIRIRPLDGGVAGVEVIVDKRDD